MGCIMDTEKKVSIKETLKQHNISYRDLAYLILGIGTMAVVLIMAGLNHYISPSGVGLFVVSLYVIGTAVDHIRKVKSKGVFNKSVWKWAGVFFILLVILFIISVFH